ncbi:nebulette-like [Meleagris gallopavo]|uniref:nebulette-like n=1 Tax=Meleagris gallopavo TaxID=9103 RepID=UPI0012ABFB0B|nr:nebulette-like [Meleagris gallopavo]
MACTGLRLANGLGIWCQVLYKQKHDAEKGTSDYAHMKEPPDIKHAMEVNKYQSDVSYKRDVQDTHRYTEVLNRPDIKMATEITKIISDAEYKKGRGEMTKEPAVLGRPDFEHAKGVSKLLSQVKYKEQFKKEMKSHQYNPLDCASFKQAQIASTLASDVSEFALYFAYVHYKEEFEKSKGKCIFVPDTPQLKHVKSVGDFISEVKYKGAAKKDLSNSLYQQMPATIDSVFAKELTQLQSKVRLENHKKDLYINCRGEYDHFEQYY